MFDDGEIIEGKYRVGRMVDRGGMGVVYAGSNIRIGRPVAIKVMHATIARDPSLVARFEREARAAALIRSTHIADVLDLGELPNGDRFMVMEFLEGESLAARIKRLGQLPPADLSAIAIQICDGLEKIHAARILHRDLKPANIFLVHRDEGDFVKILDLGVCKFLDSKDEPAVAQLDGTGIGDLIGTLSYISPEQLEHGTSDLDERSDIYSVGVILYRAVTGQLPYRVQDHVELLANMRLAKVTPVREIAPGIDEGFAAIIERSMEWDRAARFQTAGELRDAILKWVEAQYEVTSLLSDFLGVPKPAPPSLISNRPPAKSRRRSSPPEKPAKAKKKSVRKSPDDPSGTKSRPSRPASASLAQSTARRADVHTAATEKKANPIGEAAPVGSRARHDTDIPIDVVIDDEPDWRDDEETARPNPAVIQRGHSGTVRMNNAPLPSFPVDESDDGVTIPKRGAPKSPGQKKSRK